MHCEERDQCPSPCRAQARDYVLFSDNSDCGPTYSRSPPLHLRAPPTVTWDCRCVAGAGKLFVCRTLPVKYLCLEELTHDRAVSHLFSEWGEGAPLPGHST